MAKAAAFAFCSLVLSVLPALAGTALFPTPLHITRQVNDSISGKTTLLEEYGYGNRLVAVRGALTSIADYEKGELIEIDRDAGTYSITRFDAVAKATRAVGPPVPVEAATGKPGRALRSIGTRPTRGGRSAEFFEADVDTPSAKEKVSVGIDRTNTVSKDALEVLLGAAYPGVRSSEHEIVISAAAPASPRVVASSTTLAAPAEASYALPVEQVISFDTDGQHAEFRSTVVRLGSEAPPSDLVAIPAGARLVTSRIVAVAAEVEQSDRPTPPPAKVH